MYVPSFRKSRNGVPILNKEEIELIAVNYIQDFCPDALKAPREIDIDSFLLNYLGLKQDFQFLSHNGIYIGMMVFNDTNRIPVYCPETKRAEYISAEARTVIIDNSLLEDEREHRYRYTMGHEGGHDILHWEFFSYNPNQLSMFDQEPEPMIKCRAVPVNGKVKPPSEWDDKDRMEWQANYLSSALLMPKPMVLKLIQSCPYEKDSFIDAMYVHELVATFNVSWQAAEFRLRGLGIIKKEVSSESIARDFILPI